MIRSIRDKRVVLLLRQQVPKGLPPDIADRARDKLTLLQAAASLQDLRSRPGNRLEALRGDRAGQHAMRINAQWRLCFVWREDGAHDVEIVDYH